MADIASYFSCGVAMFFALNNVITAVLVVNYDTCTNIYGPMKHCRVPGVIHANDLCPFLRWRTPRGICCSFVVIL